MVATWVKHMVEEACGDAPFAIGDVVEHPEDGNVKIISGQYWGEHGLSNFWTWQRVDGSGSPVGEKRSGYGWKLPVAASPKM